MVDQPYDPPQTEGAITDERWDDVREQFSDLGSKVRGVYDEHADDDANPAGEMRDAVQAFAAAAERIGRTVQETFGDPDVQAKAKSAFNSLINALTDTFREASSQMQDVIESGAEEE